MTARAPSVAQAAIALLFAASAAAVLTAYGWYAALNALVPLFGGILWAAVLTFAAWGAGSAATGRWLRDDPLTLGSAVLVLLAGSAVLVATSGTLAIVHLMRPLPVLTALAAWACTGALVLVRHPPQVLGARQSAGPAWWVILLAAGLSLAAATTFAPFYDQWHYHLGFPYQWLRAGTVVTFDRQAYSFFPADMGLLYVYALAGPGGWAAQVVHWWMAVLTAAGSAALAARLGASTGGRYLAGAVFLAAPVTIALGALAGADLGVSAFAVGAVLAALRLRGEPERMRTWASAAGIFAGVAAGCKYLALATVLLPAAALIGVLAAAGNGAARRAAHALAVFAIAAAVVLSPWLLRNMVTTGNPVHPYFGTLFTGGDTRSADGRTASGIGNFDLNSAKLEAAVTLGTFSKRGHVGDIGPVFLTLAPLAALWVWRRRRDVEVWAVAGFAVLGTVAWAAGPPLGRYLLPVLAVTAALAAAAWSDLVESGGPLLRTVLTGALLALLVGNCNPLRGEYLPDQLRCFLGAEETAAYLEANCTQLAPFAAANSELPPGAKVLLIGEPRPFGIERDVVVEDPFRAPLLVELARDAASADDLARQLDGLGVTHLLWNAAEARRIAESGGRERYLAPLDPAAQRRLDGFLADHTVPVASGDWWEIAALLP